MSSTSFKSGAIGVAISDNQLTAVIPLGSGRTETKVWELEPYSRVAGDWPGLSTALQSLKTMVSSSTKSLTIALLPPVIQVRRIELPKVQGTALRMLLARNATKYFPTAREPFTVGANILSDQSPSPYLAAGMPARQLDVVLRTARTSLWEVDSVVPAHAAWTAAAMDRWPNLKSSSDHVAVPINNHFEVLEIDGGKLTGVRRYLKEEIPAHQRANLIESYAATAARFAPAAKVLGPEVLPEIEYVRRAEKKKKILRLAGMVAAAALIVIAAVYHTNAKKELKDVMAERAELRASVSQVMDGQTDIAVLSGPVSVLEKIETNSPIWSEVFVDFGGNLPNDAYITTFRGRGDSVSADAYAVKGAAVFEAMNGAKLIDSVRSTGPIRRQQNANSSKPLDQFTIAGQIPNAAPLFAPRGRNQR